uniref:Uncharacterized protein n=1 Tax=Avena sativa TaxID=4498 RepID=A0ACD5WX57_AVESA
MITLLEDGKRRHVVVDPTLVKRWSPLPVGWTKLNVDGSFHPESRIGGLGMVLRDDRGNIIFSSCRHIFSCSSPLEAELMACMEGCALTTQWSDLPCITETDCLNLVAMINNNIEDISPETFLLKEIRRLLNEMVKFKVVHIRREQNLVRMLLPTWGDRRSKPQYGFDRIQIAFLNYVRRIVIGSPN